MPPQHTTLLSPTELAYLHTSLTLSPPIRPDARSPTTFRPLIAETELLPSANGSARLCFADGMEGIVGVKAELERTSNARQRAGLAGHERDDEDFAMGDIEVNKDAENEEELKVADEWVEMTIDMPGQREDDSMIIFLAQMTHEGLVADGTLPRRLYINERWHWRLYIDVRMTLPNPNLALALCAADWDSTYPLPLLSLSTHLALLSTYLPALISKGDEDPLFNDDWDAALPLYASTKGKQNENITISKPSVTLLVISVGDNLFFDPSPEELAVADAVMAVTLTSSTQSGARVLAIRTIDPPSRLSPSSSAALGGEPGFRGEVDGNEGTWKPRRGGIKKEVLGKMVGICVKPGGIGEEVLGGLQGFT
ncbi:MAG: hypothetical protein Q9217_003777 [Psora testacea]